MTRRVRAARAKIAPEIEKAIVQLAFEQPQYGQDRVARELRSRRLNISASGVRYVWQRHNLEVLEKRIRHIERVQRKTNQPLSTVQSLAQARVTATKRSRRNAITLGSGVAGEFHRGNYILTVAARLFRDRGYDATSLRDIARAAEIPIGSLYYHFPSKDELFAAVYVEAMGRVTRKVTDAIASTVEPWERLHAACAAHLRTLCERDEFAIAFLAAQVAGVDAPVRERLNILNDRYEDIYRTLLEALPLPAQIDRTLLRLQILGAVIWTSVWFKAGKATPDHIALHLINALRMPLDPTKGIVN